GNTKTAIKLNKNIVEIANATSFSLALMTGLVAAIAEPPQIDVPTPMRILKFSFILNTFIKRYTTINAANKVIIIIGNDFQPIAPIDLKLNVNPSTIML